MGRYYRQLFPFCALVFVFALWSFWVPESFLSVQNLLNVLRRASISGIAAVGMTFVIIIAGIDLSVGAVLAVSGMVGAMAMLCFSGAGSDVVAGGAYVHLDFLTMLGGTLICLLAGGAAGFLNGTLIARLKLSPFLVTLGTMAVFRGASMLINSGRPLVVNDYNYLDSGKVAGIPAAVALFFAVLIAGGFLLQYTTFGRYIRALGSSPRTALYAGLDVTRLKIGVYTLCGALAGVASLVWISRVGAAHPSDGNGFELEVIASVLIGGASPSGGRGTMLGTLVGVLLINFLRNGLMLLDVPSQWQLIMIGGVIVAAVAGDRWELHRNAVAN